MRRALSRWCRPIEGSSSTYITPVRPEPIWLARRMRCASPPESESAERSKRKVVQAHVDEELQPVGDLPDDPVGDCGARAGQLRCKAAE